MSDPPELDPSYVSVPLYDFFRNLLYFAMMDRWMAKFVPMDDWLGGGTFTPPPRKKIWRSPLDHCLISSFDKKIWWMAWIILGLNQTILIIIIEKSAEMTALSFSYGVLKTIYGYAICYTCWEANLLLRAAFVACFQFSSGHNLLLNLCLLKNKISFFV